jgi:hypothetical protein
MHALNGWGSRGARRLAHVIGLLAAGWITSASSQPGPAIEVLVPRFAWVGDGNLGYNVAFALNHEIFKTFSLSIPARADGRFDQADTCCLPSTATAILDAALPQQSAATAIDRARRAGAELVLWGEAWPYGNDVVVQSFLGVAAAPTGLPLSARLGEFEIDYPFDADGQWVAWELEAGGRTIRILGLPSDAYELPPIVFDAQALANFASFQNMPVYDCGETPCPNAAATSRREVARTGSNLRALQHVREWTLIALPAGTRPAGEPSEGWIELPILDAGEGMRYIGGLVHFMRGNWHRARIAFEAVAQDPGAVVGLRRDAALLLAATDYRLDASCGRCAEAIALAKTFNPHARATAQFEVTAALATALSSNDDAVYRALLDRLASDAVLFPPNDPFTNDMTAVLTSLLGTSSDL